MDAFWKQQTDQIRLATLLVRLGVVKSFVVAFSILIAISANSPVLAHKPGDARVQPMVDRSVAYLSSLGLTTWEHETLVGYALIKAGVEKTHPRVVAAVNKVVDRINSGLVDNDPSSTYAPALAVLLLCEVDDQLFRPQIQVCLDLLASRQIPNGGFAYSRQVVADVSQTQYACLAFWAADRHQFQVDPAIGKRALEYLIRAQTLDGGFSYQGLIQNDTRVTHSMSAGGGGTLYIIAAWLGYGEDETTVRRRPEEEGLPRSVRLVVVNDAGEPAGRNGDKKIEINEAGLRAAQGKVAGWFASRFTVRDIGEWTYYYLYGFERYASFVEASSGKVDEEPDWYNQGVEFLETQQSPDGSFYVVGMEPAHIHTAFALLFLVRSTKKSLDSGAWSDGRLVGGQGLSDDAKLVMKGGRLVNLEVSRDLGDLKGLLEADGDDSDFGALQSVDSLTVSSDDPEVLQQNLAMLRTLMSHRNFDLRFLAAKALGDVQELDNVPSLIFGMTDPAEDIVRVSNESLRRIARKFDDKDFDLPVEFSRARADEVRNKWIEWYLSLRPGANLYVQGRE